MPTKTIKPTQIITTENKQSAARTQHMLKTTTQM